MANNTISILITAKDEASKQLGKLSDSLEQTAESGRKSNGVISSLRENWVALAGVAAGAGVAFHGLTSMITDNVDAAIRLQSALMGLNSVAKAFGQDAGNAERAARLLASDGLMTVTDAARGLKNLLASGFSLDQATELMKRFKDSAAFGRQASLSFGEAIASATEGIKNGNSILVDNAGVTKNLSIILEEAGYSAQDLMKATQDAGIRQAIFNGILKETRPMLGDATKLADSYAGQQARAAAQTEILRARIGESLQPALAKLLETLTPMIEHFAKFTQDHPQVVAAVVLIGTAVTGLIALLGTLGLAVTGLGPIFAAMSPVAVGAIGAVKAATTSLFTLIGGGAVMGGIVTAGAMADIALVMKAVQSVIGAINDMNNAKAAADRYIKTNQSSINELKNIYYLSGDATARDRAGKALHGMGVAGFAEGGFTGTGNRDDIAGVVHRGEYVVPKSQVDQSTGKPKLGGVTIQNLNVNNNVDVGLVVRQLSWQLAMR